MVVMQVIYAALIGLMVGSFLNVVIFRLPRAILNNADASLSCLMWPASMAPCCGHALSWRENIPAISWLMLRGRCAHCAAPITSRYIIIELLGSAAFAWAAWQFGLGLDAVAYALFMAIAISLFFINLETRLLPDVLTMSMLWLGLLAGTQGFLPISLNNAVFGAGMGFLLPWSINQFYRRLRGHDGLEASDCKLLAALGTWTGWGAIVPIVGVASLLALLVAGTTRLLQRQQQAQRQGFACGPYLIVSGLGVLMASLLR